MEIRSSDVHGSIPVESSPGEAADSRGWRLGDAQRRIAALTRRVPDDVAPPTDRDRDAVADELSALAEELSVAHEQLRFQTNELEKARQSLESERARFRELFEVSPEGHVITDLHGTIREANRGAGGLLNLSLDYLIGKPLAVFVDPGDRQSFRVRAYRARNQSAEEEWTLLLRPRNSEPIRAFLAVSPMLDAGGSVKGLRWLIRDLSKRRAGAVLERTPAAVLRSAIDALSAHVAVVDRDGTIVTTNRSWNDAQRPAGLFSASGVGANYLELCDEAMANGLAGAEIVRSTVGRVLDGRDRGAEVVYSDTGAGVDQGSQDNTSWFALRVAVCDGPEPALSVVTHEDITAQRHAQAQEKALLTERSARAAAEAASRAKSEFLATLSHELRTPLNAIAGYAQLLEMGVRGPVTGQQAEDLRRILRSEQHLHGLINELLNFARLERGEVSVDVQRVSVVEMTKDVVELVQPQATEKGLRLIVACDETDLSVIADPDRLRQILLNLLTNAVKFTPRGGTVRVECRGDGSRVTIAVHDTGIGIPYAKQELVFDPFVQIDRGVGSSPEGIGLGLSICRTLARAMDGDVTLRSEPGSGSTFELSLPRGTEDPAVS